MSRPTRDQMYLKIAETIAQRATCPRASVGCVLTKDNGIIAVSYNGAPSEVGHCTEFGCYMEDGHCIRATHAEANALAHCARLGIPTLGAEAWVTHSPCQACAKLLIRAGIWRVTYLEAFRGEGPTHPGLELLQASNIITRKGNAY